MRSSFLGHSNYLVASGEPDGGAERLGNLDVEITVLARELAIANARA